MMHHRRFWQLITSTSRRTHNCTRSETGQNLRIPSLNKSSAWFLNKWLMKYREIQIWATVPLSRGIPLHYRTCCFNEKLIKIKLITILPCTLYHCIWYTFGCLFICIMHDTKFHFRFPDAIKHHEQQQAKGIDWWCAD